MGVVDAGGCGILALAAALSLWQARRRDPLGADEGYLWYGVQQTLAGRWPHRDVKSYEPGRYLWSAAFARVFLRDPGVVVLDEASSRLDPATERLIERAVDRLLAGRTGLIIAHRLTTVRDADLVVFMDKGKVIEYGGFTELSLRNGRFAALLRAGGLLNDEEVRRLSRAVNEAA